MYTYIYVLTTNEKRGHKFERTRRAGYKGVRSGEEREGINHELY